MSTELQTLIASIMEKDDLRFDDNGLMSHELPWGQLCHFRWFKDAGCLLVSIAVGTLRSDDLESRSLSLLSANNIGYLTAGGALGLDQKSNDVFLSRSFILNPDPSMLVDSLAGLPSFLSAGQIGGQIIQAINAIEIDPENGISVRGISPEELIELQRDLHRPPPEEGGEPDTELTAQIDEYHRFVRAALQSFGINEIEADENHAYYFSNEDGLYLEISFDSYFEEVFLKAVFPIPANRDLMKNGPDWLAANLFVEKTSNCTLGLSEDLESLSLSYALSLEAVQPSPTALANVISRFWANAKEWREKGRESGSNMIPGMMLNQFV